MNVSQFLSSNPSKYSGIHTQDTTRQRYAISHFTENFTIGVSCDRGGECMIFRDRMGKERKERRGEERRGEKKRGHERRGEERRGQGKEEKRREEKGMEP